MKPDERIFLLALARPECQSVHATGLIVQDRAMPRDVAAALGIHYKRAEYLYHKWTGKGWYEWGVSSRTGWLTEAGLVAVAAMLTSPV